MKSILKLFFGGCAALSGFTMIMLLLTSLSNIFFGTHLGIWVGPLGARSSFESPDKLIDLLAWETMFGVFFSICLIIYKADWIWAKIKKYPVWGALFVIIYLSLLSFFVFSFIRDLDGGELNVAIEKNDKVLVEELIHKISPKVEMSGYFFIEAARFDSVDVIPVLVKNGYDINAGNAEGTTALMAAAGMWFRPAMVDLLLDNGASVDVKDNEGNTALLLALKGFDRSVYSETDLEAIVTSLVKASPDKSIVNESDHSGLTPLVLAKDRGTTKILKILE